jgi:hypothetical protein
MKKILLVALSFACLNLYSQDDLGQLLKGKGYGKNTWAIIIANEDYQSNSSLYVENEELAILQAEKFQQFLIKKTGVPSEHILFYADAVNTHIKLAIARLQKTLPPRSSLIFYYRGKTYTDEGTNDLYLVPVDVADNETFYMFGVNDLCKRLSVLDVTSMTILVDSKSGTRTGTQGMITNGFIEDPLPPPARKNMSLLRLKTISPDINEQHLATAGKPGIIITEPSSATIRTSESSCIIRGRVSSDCPVRVISVNGQEAHYSADGSFIARVALNEGENNIAVEAANCAGWSKENLIFDYSPAKTEEADAADSAEFADNNHLRELGKNFAVIIGESKYRDPMMPDLFYPTSDAKKVKQVLINNYTFDNGNTLLLENATRKTIIDKLDSINKVLTAKDNLLIFYAGHGSWDEKTNIGYWLPSDAAATSTESWLMNSLITAYVSRCNARHTLVIADACFGGSIFRTRAFKPEEEKAVSDLYLKMSKKAMTSGDLTEVPDESIFVKNFILLLTENTEEYLPSQKLFFDLKPRIVNTIDLIPQFGIIKNAGDQGGDFIFFRKTSGK